MTRQRHSRSYHRYFENYAEKEILSEDGRYIIQRVYTGHYYRTDMTDEALIRQRRNILVLTILSEVGYLVGAILCGVSSVSIVAIATMPPLIAGILLAVSVFLN